MLYIGKKQELTEYFRSIPIEQKAQLYRGIRSIMAMLVKVSKMTEIYSVRDKIFAEFTETMKQNMDVIHNLLPFATVTTKKVGFYYQERKIKLFDEGERKACDQSADCRDYQRLRPGKASGAACQTGWRCCRNPGWRSH